jgi:hypothetical protein
MRGEVLLFLPMAGRLRITDEYRETTYGSIEQRSLGKPQYPHQREAFRFLVRIELAGITCAEEFDDMIAAQSFAESFLRAHGQLG